MLLAPPLLLPDQPIPGLRLSVPPDGDERRPIPGWLWPSSIVLGRLLVGPWSARVRGRVVCELGCGVGAVGLAAAVAGADVTLTDHDPDALALAAHNARASGLSVTLQALDWTRVPDALAGSFDVVLGSDVLYQANAIAPVLGAIEVLLAPGGEALLAEPGRVRPDDLASAARSAGLLVETLHEDQAPPPRLPWSDFEDPRVVSIHALRRGD